jgi:hypothetical protein
VKFVEHKEQKEEFSDNRKFVERMITKRDIAAVLFPVFANFYARETGTVYVSKVISSLMWSQFLEA